MINLGSKTYAVIGASGGVGKKLSEQLISMEGVQVILVARNKNKISDLIEGKPNSLFMPCDLNKSEQIEQLFTYLCEQNIKLDGLIYCAGISPLMKVVETNIELMRETFQVNVISFIEIMKWFLREEISNSGASVVVMSSVAANIPTYRQTVYSSTKSALEEAVRCIAKEGKERLIRVNALSAGAIDTEMLGKLMQESESLREKLERYYPFGLISTDKIAQNIIYLLSDYSANTTGSVLNIDSGFLINK